MSGALEDVARIMINGGLDVWGFTMFKTWGYRDYQGKWGNFWERWKEFLDDVLGDNGVEGGLTTELPGKLMASCQG
jgi:hypothetical protein